MNLDLPEPLWETSIWHKKMCLVCAERFATNVLRTIEKEVVPICKNCSADWNFYGYEILKKIEPKRLILKTFWFKLKNLWGLSMWSVWKDVQALRQWAKKMKKWVRN